MQTHTSTEIAQAKPRNANGGMAEMDEIKVIGFALSHLPGSTRAMPVPCRYCLNTGLHYDGGRFVECKQAHTEDGVECCECHDDAAEYVWVREGDEAYLMPMCDGHKAKAVKDGVVLVQVPAVRS